MRKDYAINYSIHKTGCAVSLVFLLTIYSGNLFAFMLIDDYETSYYFSHSYRFDEGNGNRQITDFGSNIIQQSHGTRDIKIWTGTPDVTSGYADLTINKGLILGVNFDNPDTFINFQIIYSAANPIDLSSGNDGAIWWNITEAPPRA